MRYKILLIIISVLFLTTSSVLSHGFGRQLVEQEVVGPYTVSVWVEPEAVQPGDEVHFTISLQNDTAGKFITTAAITVTAEHPDETVGALTIAAVTGLSANPAFYEGQMDIQDAGDWTVSLSITGPDGDAEVEFPLEVGADSGSNGASEDSNLNELGQVLGLIGIGIVTLAVIFQALRQRVKE